MALNRDAIVSAAIAVLDESGLAGLNMRALADRLGVQAAALYRHFTNKDELLASVVDSLLGEVRLTLDAAAASPENWSDVLRRLGTSHREMLRAHPAVLSIALAVPPGPNWLRMLETTLGVLRRSGFSARDALCAVSAVNDLVTGSAQLSRSYVRDPAGPGTWDHLALLPSTDFPCLVEVANEMKTGGDEEVFAQGLAMLIAGLESRVPEVRTGRP